MTEAEGLPNLEHGFSSQKREVLLLLKRRPDASLSEIANELGISRVAALRHLSSLEQSGLIERSYRVEGVGRPRARFRLTGGSVRLFPEAYTHMSICALKFIEEHLGHDAVVTLLQQRTREVADEHRSRFHGTDLRTDVRELVRIRTEGGYMAEMGTARRGSIEMLEHHCPILAIAQHFPEACDVERRMFESLLHARVDVSHRVAAGDPVCRFLVRPKSVPA